MFKKIILIAVGILGSLYLYAQDATTAVTHESAPNAKDGAIDLTVTGGYAPYTFSWEGPGGFMATTEDITGLAPGVYCVTVTDAMCGSLTICDVVRNCDPILAFGGTVDCPYNAKGKIWVDLIGKGPFNIEWSDGLVQTASGPGKHERINMAPGSYCVTVTNTAGCSETACQLLQSMVDPIIINGDINHALCGQSVGGVNAIVTGGLSPYTYTWSNGATGPSISGVGPGRYTLTVTDNNGCTSSASFGVRNDGAGIKVFLASIDMISECADAPTCDGSINIEVAGGNAPYMYDWTGPGPTSNQQDQNGLCARGAYSVTVTDKNGCTGTGTFNICCCKEPDVPAGGSDVGVCTVKDFQITGFANSIVGGQLGSINIEFPIFTPEVSITWEKDGQFFSNDKNLKNLSAGLYCVTVDNGCVSDSKCFTITNCDDVTINLLGTTESTCPNIAIGAVNLDIQGNGLAPFSFQWSNGQFTQNIKDLVPGVYTVIVRDKQNCTATGSFTVTSEQIETRDIGCTRLFFCGDQLVGQQEFPQQAVFDHPTDCRLFRIICENGFQSGYMEEPTTVVIDPFNCIIREFCTSTGGLFKIHTGQMREEDVVGFTDCGFPVCGRFRFCFYPQFNFIDPNSVVKITDFQKTFSTNDNLCDDLCGAASNCGLTTQNGCVNNWFCNGQFIGRGCGAECCFALTGESDSSEIKLILDDARNMVYQQLSAKYSGNGSAQLKTISMDEYLDQKGLTLFPNPTEGSFYLKFDKTVLGASSVEVLNTSGQRVFFEQFVIEASQAGNAMLFQLDHRIPAGIYTVTVKLPDGQLLIHKLVKS